MKDPVFTGSDVAAALVAAGAALGSDPRRLRYVVLDSGSPAARGLQPTPARIAVILGSEAEARGPGPGAADPRESIAAVLKRIGAAAAASDFEVEVDDSGPTVAVRLSGTDTAFFLDQDGEVLRAVEHLLQRMFGRVLHPQRLSLECEGFRERREERLKLRAIEIANAVRADGRPRTTEALNAYERRIVHMAVAEQEGLRTYSVGEGSRRRVTIATTTPDADPPTAG